MKAMNAADELAMVRARIAQLRAREIELREALIGSDPPGRLGRWAEARVIEHRVRHFDHRLLPFDLQADPLFWREKVKKDIALALREEGEPGPAAACGTRGRSEARLPLTQPTLTPAPLTPANDGPTLSAADVAVLLRNRLH